MTGIDRALFKAARFLTIFFHSLPPVRTMLKLGLFGGLAAILRGYFELEWRTVGVAVVTVYLATGGWRFAKILVRTLPRDLK